MNNDTKKLSTIWLDFVSYIFMPFYFLTLSIETVDSFESKNPLKIILLILCTIYTVCTIYNVFRKNKIAYYLMYGFITYSIITIIIYFSNKFNITNIKYILEFIGVGVIVWIIPNFIYLYKRKDIFRKHNVSHIKKCPGCNRIIPIHMESCGRCGYKEKKK